MFMPALLGLFAPACLGQKVAAEGALAILQETGLLDSAQHRGLQSDACASEASQADSCLGSKFSSTSSSEYQACSACYQQAVQAAANSLAQLTSVTCQDLDTYICAPVESCSCFGSCSAVFGELVECAIKAAYPQTASCSITCQNPASGGISIATGLGYGMTGMTAMAFALM
jgi:hypothetical protein